MKKLIFMLFSVIMLVGCSTENQEIIESQLDSVAETTMEITTEMTTETTIESTTVKPTETEKTELTYTEIADNIKLYDLTQSENSDYLKYLTESSYNNEYEMSKGKISAENGNIYLEDFSGERTALIELPVESETVYVVISCIIDDSRFAYNIIQEDSSLGCGVYNLDNKEGFRIESEERCHYSPQKVSGDYLILTRGFIADFYGYSKLNLKTFQLTDIDTDFIENKRYLPCMAFSSDMKMTANISADYSENSEYTVTMFSLENEKATEEYKFSSKNRYINFDLQFISDNKLYIYALKEGDSEFSYLYIINLPVVEIADNIKLYDLTLPENTELIPAEKTLYSKEIEMAGYGILSNEDGNIKLVKDNCEENIIVESPYPDLAYSWVKTEFPIDSDRFAYSVCGEMGNPGFGVYDMKNGENHLVMESYYPKVIRGNSLILAKGKYFNTVGYSELDLDSYEIRDIPIQADLENLKYYRTNDVTADGRLSAVMKYEDDSYIITVISLESGEVTNEYILKTDNKYGNMELEFISADKLHLYAKRHEDNTYHLYVFDIA